MLQAELSEDGGHSDDHSDDDGDAAEQEKLLVGSLTCMNVATRKCTLRCALYI